MEPMKINSERQFYARGCSSSGLSSPRSSLSLPPPSLPLPQLRAIDARSSETDVGARWTRIESNSDRFRRGKFDRAPFSLTPFRRRDRSTAEVSQKNVYPPCRAGVKRAGRPYDIVAAKSRRRSIGSSSNRTDRRVSRRGQRCRRSARPSLLSNGLRAPR